MRLKIKFFTDQCGWQTAVRIDFWFNLMYAEHSKFNSVYLPPLSHSPLETIILLNCSHINWNFYKQKLLANRIIFKIPSNIQFYFRNFFRSPHNMMLMAAMQDFHIS